MTVPGLERQIGVYVDHLVVERGIAENTLLSYGRDLRRYREYLESRGIPGLDGVTAVDVEGFAAQLLDGDRARGIPPLAASSAARTLVAVRGLHRFAAREGIARRDVAAEVRPPAPGRRLPKALDVDQVTRLIEAASGPASDSPRGLRDRALLEFLYSTGARISEAVGLDIDDLDLDNRAVLLRGKGGRERVVPIGGPAVSALGDYLVRARPSLVTRSGAAVFLNLRGGRLSRQSAWQVLRDAADRAGIGGHVSPHTLRHSFATHLLDGGADVRVVQELLGHASVTTTQIYTLVTVDSLREVWSEAHPRAR